MSDLIHYIFVRRDLPVGVMAAMVTHAAGESAARYVANYNNDTYFHAIAVVLEAKDDTDLCKIGEYLYSAGLDYVHIIESGGPYDGQLMAYGLIPNTREHFGELLKPFQLLKQLDNLTVVEVKSPTSHDKENPTTTVR